MTTALLVHNPASRSSLGVQALERALAQARDYGWACDLVRTQHPGHATEIAREAAAAGTDVLLVNGGDGTLNEAIQGLAHSRTALAVIPGGTANVWAKEIGVSRKPQRAVHAALTGVRRRVDLGRAGGRYFLLMTGVGFDALVVPRVGPKMKRRLGAVAYVIAGAKPVLTANGWLARLTIDGTAQETPLFWLVAGNTRNYGGFRDITNRAMADDGRLDVVLMHRGGLWRIIVDGVRLLLGRHAASPNIDYLRVESVDIETAGIPLQLDGEYAGTTPMRIEAVASALDVIVPAGVRTPLIPATLAAPQVRH
jgi:YegS/Rv2252/BmrU family lipid kinase